MAMKEVVRRVESTAEKAAGVGLMAWGILGLLTAEFPPVAAAVGGFLLFKLGTARTPKHAGGH